MTEQEINEKYSVLTLQITKASFDAILKGEQKVETRLISYYTAKRYFNELPTMENWKELRMWKYDLLKLINGRRKDAPTLYVETTNAYFYDNIDENGNTIAMEEVKGDMPALDACYELGEVIFSKNIS